eukprot:109140_1
MSKPRDQNDLVSRAQRLQNYLQSNKLIKDRTWKLKNYKQCFIGKEIIPVIINLKLIPVSLTNRSENESNAIQFGNELINASIIQHVTKQHKFKNAKLYYEFTRGYNNNKRRKSIDIPNESKKDDTFSYTSLQDDKKSTLQPKWNDKYEPSINFSVSNTRRVIEIEEKRQETQGLARQKTEALLQESLQTQIFSNLKKSLTSSACTIIVFGASGHLAKTKTYPALYDLYCEGIFPDNVNIIGYARSKLNKSNFNKKISIKLKGQTQHDFLERCHYFAGKGYDDDASYKLFSEYICKLEDETYGGKSNRIIYLATPPTVFVSVCERIKKYLYDINNGWLRVIIEKPFGKDLESSNKLDYKIGKFFNENEIYRIDHYLAKEMVQNIIVFRFANILWNSIWNRHHIKCIKISMKESTGLDGRGGYYDEYGVIRDVLQNHLFQVLTLITMEQPCTLNSEDIRNEKVKILKCIQPMKESNTIVGQYKSYRDDPSIKNSNNCNSNQITFVQTILYINNHRWNKVPFICKCGKGLDAKNTEIRIQFNNDELCLFPNANFNEIVMRLQPNEAIWCKVNTKTPGFARFDNVQMFELDFTYKNRSIIPKKLPSAYSRLILDTLRGDQSLFVRSDELRESWRIVTPFLHKLESENKDPIKYLKGSRGPIQADEMAKQFGFRQSVEYNWQEPQL